MYPNSWRVYLIKLAHIGLGGSFRGFVSCMTWRDILSHPFVAAQKEWDGRFFSRKMALRLLETTLGEAQFPENHKMALFVFGGKRSHRFSPGWQDE